MNELIHLIDYVFPTVIFLPSFLQTKKPAEVIWLLRQQKLAVSEWMSFLAEGPGARPWGSSPGKPWGAQALADDEFAMILWRRLRHIKGMFCMGVLWEIDG